MSHYIYNNTVEINEYVKFFAFPMFQSKYEAVGGVWCPPSTSGLVWYDAVLLLRHFATYSNCYDAMHTKYFKDVYEEVC